MNAMTAFPPMEGMSANEKRALMRRTITAHPDWPAYKKRHGTSIGQIASIADAVRVANDLGIACNDTHATSEQESKGMDGSTERKSRAQAEADGLFGRPETKEKPAPVQDAPDDVTGALIALKRALGGSVDADAVRAIVEDAVAPIRAIVQDQAPVLLVVQEGKPERKVEGLRHKTFETLLRVMAARDTSGKPVNVWLSGPSQSGKTTAAEKAAEALGLDFGFHGAMTMAHELVGFVDAAGTYHETQFVKLFRNGGVCLLDEVDAGSNEALLALNAALANGLMSLPDGEMVKRHPDFIAIGAANTWGSGATADYIGRAKLDAAFMQRFPVKLFWDYDEDLERKFCGNPDFAIQVQAARAKAKSAGLKILITPSHSKAGAALIAGGFTMKQAADLTYLAGLSTDQVNLIEG